MHRIFSQIGNIMKIEIGESLIYSWLRHIKKCQITQLNWKASQEWDTTITDNLLELTENISSKFNYPFGKTKDLSSIIKQSEIDAIGFDFITNTIYGIDVAFHSNGLGYADNVKRVAKKILRTVLIFELYFENSYEKKVIFATPKANPKENEKILNRIEEIKQFLKEKDFDTQIDFIANDRFKKEILTPVLSLSEKVADTAELFLRSYQLIQLFDSKTATLKKDNKAEQKEETFNKVKIGKLVRDTFNRIFKDNLLSDNEIQNLMNVEYCKKIFDMNYPILKEINHSISLKEQRKINGYDRYYAKPFENKYLLCNDWYERNRKLFDIWRTKQGIK